MHFNKLEMLEGNQVILQNEAKLPIGKSYKKELLNRL